MTTRCPTETEGGPRPTLLRTHNLRGIVGWASARLRGRSRIFGDTKGDVIGSGAPKGCEVEGSAGWSVAHSNAQKHIPPLARFTRSVGMIKRRTLPLGMTREQTPQAPDTWSRGAQHLQFSRGQAHGGNSCVIFYLLCHLRESTTVALNVAGNATRIIRRRATPGSSNNGSLSTNSRIMAAIVSVIR
jgi:hypothetical protein